MTFWGDKVAELRPVQQEAPRKATAWWQPEPATALARPSDPISAPPSPNPTNYTPPTSARLKANEERCPRCQSEDYVEVPLDLTYGGRGGMSETGVNLGRTMRCMECRYPNYNPSGQLVRGMAGGKAKKQQVRQLGGGDGSWGPSSWDNAPVIA